MVDARIVRIVDRLIEVLGEIDGDETLWRTNLAGGRVDWFRGTDDLDKPMPRVLLKPEPSAPDSVVRQMGGANGTWRETREIAAIVLSNHSSDPWREVGNVSGDVRKRIRQLNGTLLDSDGELLAMLVKDGGSDLAVDADLAGAGFGQDFVTISVTSDVGADGA
jgi:hypothetical protein